MPATTDLTLYTVTPQIIPGADRQHEYQIVLGHTDAHQEAARFMGFNDVLSVTCEPLAPGSQTEQDAIVATYYNGMDLGAPLLPLAEEAGLDVDPENFDPYALLLALRDLNTKD